MAKDDVCTKVRELLEGFLADSELEIYRVTYKKEGPEWILRVVLDKNEQAESEYVSIEECEEVTRYLSDRLDEADFIGRSYNLEVGSPGLDRELLTDRDFVRFGGRAVEVKTYEPINGSKYFEGTLIGRDNGMVSIEAGNEVISIPQEKISRINLAVVF
jgi:ribosome maturation factor RimP